MGEERRRRDSAVDGGPGSAHLPFMMMESFFDKLKLLQYDREFYQEIRLKPISRHFFALQTNPGEQFFMFAALSAWLIRKMGRRFDTPQEHDDPNSTIASILDVLKDLGVTVDFPPNRLKQGYGENVIFVLMKFADAALKKTNFMYKRPAYKPEEEEKDEDDEDSIVSEKGMESSTDDIEEMIEEDFDVSSDEDEDDEDETDLLDLEGLSNLQTGKHSAENDDFNKPDGIMESNVDLTEWKLEIERVLPQLKVTIKNDSKDWRSHIEQIHQHRNDISDNLSSTKTQLDKLYTDISHTLEKINSREKYLNNQLEQLIVEYRTAQDRLSQVKEQYKSVSGGVTERSQTLAQITEELEQIKQEMDERGSNMTDGKPLVNIRKALTKIKAELGQMDVRIGVASHTLLQARLKEKGNLQRAANVYSQPAYL